MLLQILVLLAFIVCWVTVYIANKKQGKKVQGKTAKEMFEKLGGQYLETLDGGVWFEKDEKTYWKWRNLKTFMSILGTFFALGVFVAFGGFGPV